MKKKGNKRRIDALTKKQVMRYFNMKTTYNKELQDKLETRYENHGYDGEKSIIVPIMYDPKTGFTYDVGDLHDIEGEDDVHGTEQTEVQDS